MGIKYYIVVFIFCVSTNGFSQSHAGKDNELVEFHRSGSWELWCLRLGPTGPVECNLNLVLRYKDHPDFRAMIPRIFWRNSELITVWGAEWQTSLNRASIQTSDNQSLQFLNCGRPCQLSVDWTARLIEIAKGQSEVSISFHDYWIEEFNEPLPLDGLPEGVELLKRTQDNYN